ncbi:MAG TPA: hypothetical protein VGE74_27270 [Gemmata sp.]
MADVPELFRLTNPARDPEAVPPTFSTPLGRLVLGLEIAGRPVPPAATFTASDHSVALWTNPARLEVLLTAAPADLPPGMTVGGARAAVWRVRGANPALSFVLTCLWTGAAGWTDVGPETGENLDAQTWTDGHTRVTVGLPDYETATAYRRDGFAVTVRAVPGSQGHFLCAWGPDAPDDISTWFAVDWPTARLVPAGAEPAPGT